MTGALPARLGQARLDRWGLGIAGRISRCWPDRLTVLTYHRVNDPLSPAFKGLRANVSASPEAFTAQLDLLGRWFNIVSLDDILAWLDAGRPLPPRAALITFDDGYRDNFDLAWPLLRARGLPAVLFAATRCIGATEPFWWDLAAHAFAATGLDEAELPLLGRQRLGDPDALLPRWLAAAHTLPAGRVPGAARALARSLGVTPSPDTFADLYLDWDRLRRMAAGGFAVGAHTHSHPRLAGLALEEARADVRHSRECLERELGRPVRAFAYPHGGPGDFGPEHERMLAEAGFAAAFSTYPGPQPYAAARRWPLRLRRINVSQRDGPARFAGKLLGLGRLR